jgi:hypothetical protein
MKRQEWTRARWAGFLIGGISLALLCGAPGPVSAQPDGAPAATLAARADSPMLPDAPLPVAPAGSALERAAAQSSSASPSTQSPAQGSQPPTQGSPTPPGAPSLSDLGLTPAETEGSAARQAIMDRRSHMLKIHQRLGLITVIPVAAACITAAGAPPKRGDYSNTADRDLHVALGATSVAMYALTASYAIRAPKVSNEHARGGVKWHKYLIYIHAPGMILTPILGAMAFNQINSGQKVHGIASAHGPVAIITAGSYGAAIIAVSWPIHLKF